MRTLHNLHKIEVAPNEIGVTARNGDKWADALDQKIELCECEQKIVGASLMVKTGEIDPVIQTNHTTVGHAVVVEVWSGKFKDLPARYIEHEHELSSRLYSGLLSSMRRAYGATFSQSNPVTVLVYKRYD